jgi:hypothetical protein
MHATTDVAVGERLVNKSFPPISRHTLALYCGASGYTSIWISPERLVSTTFLPTVCWR